MNLKNHFFSSTFALFLMLFFSLIARSQESSLPQLKSAYISNFIQEVTWEESAIADTFQIGFIGGDTEVLNHLIKMARLKKIKNKPISITSFTSIADIRNINVLFVSDDYNNSINVISKQIGNRQILLITDSYDDDKLIMINFIHNSDSKLSFEINKIPFIQKKMSFSKQLIALGGKEIDVAQLYQEYEDEILKQKTKLEQQQNVLKENIEKVEKSKKEIITFQSELTTQENKIDALSNQIELRNEELTKNQEYFQTLQKAHKNKEDELSALAEKFGLMQGKVEELGGKILESKTILNTQDSLILSKSSIIETQKTDISSKEELISDQKKFLYYAIAIILFISALAYVFFRTNQIIKQSAKQLEQKNKEIKEQQIQLIHSEKMASLGLLTAGVAHELNNPINYIYGGAIVLKRDVKNLIELLAKYEQIENGNPKLEVKKEIEDFKDEIGYTDLAENIQQILEDIKMGSDRATKIVKGLSSFSRMDTENRETTNIHTGLDDTITILSTRFKNEVNVVKNYDNSIGEIQSYPGQLNQVFMNLIINAEQAIKDKGEITISTKNLDDKVEIIIKDNGVGIDKELAGRIFDPFFTTKEVGEGTGLGLSIAHGIIKKHNGEINVESENGRGTEFTITLPKT